MPKYKVKVEMVVVEETEITADDHEHIKKIVEAETLRKGYKSAKITYIKSSKQPEVEDDEELDFDLDLHYPP